jgi:hypothetical protein
MRSVLRFTEFALVPRIALDHAFQILDLEPVFDIDRHRCGVGGRDAAARVRLCRIGRWFAARGRAGGPECGVRRRLHHSIR